MRPRNPDERRLGSKAVGYGFVFECKNALMPETRPCGYLFRCASANTYVAKKRQVWPSDGAGEDKKTPLLGGVSKRPNSLNSACINIAARKPMTVLIVPHQQEHLAATFAWLTSDERLRQQIDTLSPPPSEEVNELVWRKRWTDASRKDFAIVADGWHVGNCGLTDLDLHRRKAQLWIYIGEGRGSGAGSDAVRKLLAYAFDELGLHRIYIRVLATNSRAISFYTRLGFSLEGIFRHDTIQNGEPVDSFAMAIVADGRRRAVKQTSEHAAA